MSKNEKIIHQFLDYYFKNPKKEYQKDEIPQYKFLIDKGILVENILDSNILEIKSDSTDLLETVLEIVEFKTGKKLPLKPSEAFLFIKLFEDNLREEYKPHFYNSYDSVIKKFKIFVLSLLFKKGVKIKEFLFSLSDENREHHLYNFERIFFEFLPKSDYNEKEIFEICNQANSKYAEHDIILFLRNSFEQDKNFGNKLLNYALRNNVTIRFITDLLIGGYNSGDISLFSKIIELQKENISECLFILGRLDFKNQSDVDKAFKLLKNLDFENLEIAIQQSYLLRNIIVNNNTSENTRQKSFRKYVNLIEKGNENIRNAVFQDVTFIEKFESEKYQLLHCYLSNSGNFEVIKHFFYHFEDPKYIFDIMMRLFNITPNFRFSIDLFENGILNAWNKDTAQTQKEILNLFKQHPAFGILAIKIIFSGHFNILFVDLIKLEKAEYQINAIDSICKHPHSFDKLLPLILPLRNSKFKKVREYLQIQLAQKVFHSYHDTIHKQIEQALSNSKKDKEFLKPISKALDDYHTLKKLKESINDLNPYENEKDLMDLYYRLEHEEHAKSMKSARNGKGTFMEAIKSNIIVRGNSFKFDEGEPTPLARIESKMLIDGSSYLNPDLYESNLNF